MINMVENNPVRGRVAAQALDTIRTAKLYKALGYTSFKQFAEQCRGRLQAKEVA